MRTACKPGHPVPYSLHDMRTGSVTLRDGELTLAFETGMVRLGEPCEQVSGRVILTGVESCDLWQLSPNGRYGRFEGEKQSWERFARRHPAFSLEILDELYGYNQVRYQGYLTLPDEENMIEFCMEIYYTGTLTYETEE